jgi:hypothetical protein
VHILIGYTLRLPTSFLQSLSLGPGSGGCRAASQQNRSRFCPSGSPHDSHPLNGLSARHCGKLAADRAWERAPLRLAGVDHHACLLAAFPQQAGNPLTQQRVIVCQDDRVSPTMACRHPAQRPHARDGPGEIGSLQQSFNTMTESLAGSRDELHKVADA